MEITQDVIIERPIADIVAMLSDPDHPYHWHRDLVSLERTGGTPGQPGATARLTYNDKGRTFKLDEEIVAVRLPVDTVTTYKAAGMTHTLTTTLEEVGPTTTKVTVHNAIKLPRLAKLAGPIIEKATRGQTEVRARDLKRYLETGSID